MDVKKVRVSMSPKNLEAVIKSLQAQEDYSRIEKILDIPVTKETMEFLCKSGLIIDWDFIEERTVTQQTVQKDETPIKVVPPVVYKEEEEVKQPSPSFLRPSNLKKVEEIIFPTKKSIPTWENERDELVDLFVQYFPKQITAENALSFLMAILDRKREHPELRLTKDTIKNEVVPILPNMYINDNDKVIAAILNYLDLMLGHQTNKEQSEFFINSLHGIWDRVHEYDNIVDFFEATFSVKIAG